jgi:hypothetical protein
VLFGHPEVVSLVKQKLRHNLGFKSTRILWFIIYPVSILVILQLV